MHFDVSAIFIDSTSHCFNLRLILLIKEELENHCVFTVWVILLMDHNVHIGGLFIIDEESTVGHSIFTIVHLHTFKAK